MAGTVHRAGLLWGLIGGAAEAHQPHAVLVDVAAAEDGRRWAILDPQDTSQLLFSADAGQHWDFIGGAPTDDDLVAAAFDGERVWLAGGKHVWWLDGAVWQVETLPAVVRDLAARNGEVFAATDAGLVALLGPAGTVGAAASFSKVDVDGEGRWRAIDGQGVVWMRSPNWQRGPAPPEPALSASGPYIGTATGLWKLDGEVWTACTSLPTASEAAHAAEVPFVHWDGTHLLAATGAEALFVGDADCDVWRFYPNGDEIVYDRIGYLSDSAGAFVWAEATGDHRAVAGFDGFSISEDGGATWAHPGILPADYSRGTAWDGDRLVVGEYGGGVTFSTDGGTTWSGSAVGLTGIYGNDTVFGESRREIWHVTDLIAHRSDDDGETWHPCPLITSHNPRFGRPFASLRRGPASVRSRAQEYSSLAVRCG